MTKEDKSKNFYITTAISYVNGMEPKAFCDQIAKKFEDMTTQLNISNDDFIRTTEPRHIDASQAIWKTIRDNGKDDIYLGKYEGWYSVRDEGYFAESELTEGEDTSGNKIKLAPSGAPVEWVEEESYFFRLSAYAERLLELYEKHPEFIEPESRRNEIISFVKGGLQDISISRTNFSWGVPVPDDDKHVMYVWLDALTNYITGIGYPDTDKQSFKDFWPADYHVIGKDIIRFHCVYWMREVPHGQDGNFSHEFAVQRLNSDLANGLGNLAQRTLSMIHKNCDGKIPECGDLSDEDQILLSHAYDKLVPLMREQGGKMKFNRMLETIWRLVIDANGYVDAQAPWGLKKTDPKRMETVLYVLAEIVRVLGIAVQSIIPESADKLLNQLKIEEDKRLYAHISKENTLAPGTEIDKPEGVFPRLEANEAA